MHITTHVPIIIKRRPAEVFAALTDFDTWPQWGGGNLASMEQISTSPLQVGSQLRQVNRRGSKLTESFVEVTQLTENQTFRHKKLCPERHIQSGASRDGHTTQSSI